MSPNLLAFAVLVCACGGGTQATLPKGPPPEYEEEPGPQAMPSASQATTTPAPTTPATTTPTPPPSDAGVPTAILPP